MLSLNNISGLTLLVGGDGNDVFNASFSTLSTTMVGGLGNDTYIIDRVDPDDPSEIPDVIVEEANGGVDTVRSYWDYQLAAFVENLILLDGEGFNHVNGTGNALNNSLTGNSGNNVLDGGAGNDTMAGGLGDDEYFVDSALDVVIEAASAGSDQVTSFLANYTLTLNVEKLYLGDAALNGTGNAGDNEIRGNGGANILVGGAGNDNISGFGGNDRLEGGAGDDQLEGGAGQDLMLGGAGNDSYYIDGDDQTIVETAGAGTDTVYTESSHTLAANVENVVALPGTGDAVELTGNALNNSIVGNGLNNVLVGGAGNDTLDGGTGADRMTGGDGNDTYVVDHFDDRVIETATGGAADKVLLAYGFLVLPEFVENLQMITGGVNAFGNSLHNVMIGNDANNFILAYDGNDIIDGGAGADNMQGGRDNDTYYLDNANDYIQEFLDMGTDTVFTSISYNFYGIFYIENITLTGTGGGEITGNNQANIIKGNTGNDFLDGRGGADTMEGGLGDDIYVVDDPGDKVNEVLNATGGTDTIISYKSHTLPNFVENLTLGNTAGNIDGTGNALNNRIEGNWNNNLLDGAAGDDLLWGHAGTDTLRGGLGNDTLEGGSGNDTLEGGAGNDVLDGGSGIDTMQGGAGNDTYMVDNAAEQAPAVEAANGGTDTVRSTTDWVLQANFENLTLLGSGDINGTGNELANTLIGNAGSNSLIGGGGNDFLDGGAGVDVMVGGAGNDTYVQDDITDELVEEVNGGVDTLQIWASRGDYDVETGTGVVFALKVNFENLVMLGDDDLQGGGNDLSNTITGNAGHNVLSGRGLGTDKLIGGKGDDTYFVDQATDTITELANEGVDQVFLEFVPTGTYGLGANLEILRLSLLPAVTVNAKGNLLDNGMEGNLGANRLDGDAGNDYLAGRGGGDTLIGGAGNDYLEAGGSPGSAPASLTGGLGDDWYFVGSRNLVNHQADAAITELANQGTDSLQTSVDFDMSVAAANVENLYLADGGYDDHDYRESSWDIVATANALNNRIYGNLGDNTVSGLGGNDSFHFHSYEVDHSAWAHVTGQSTISYRGATLDGGDQVNGGEGQDALHGVLLGVDAGLHIEGVEQITLYTGNSVQQQNTIAATGIVGAERITVAGLLEDDALFHNAGTVDLTILDLKDDVQIGLTNLWASAIDDFIQVSVNLEDSSGGDDDLEFFLNYFQGGIFTADVETLYLNLVPVDGAFQSADMSASTGVEKVVISSTSGELWLGLPEDATVLLDNANVTLHLFGYAGDDPIVVGLDAAGVTLYTEAGPVDDFTLDTTGDDGASTLTTANILTGTVKVIGDQDLFMHVVQNVDASQLEGNLYLVVDAGVVDPLSLKGGLGSDILRGNDFDQRLNGGGAGAEPSNDVLYGFGGADTFVFDSAPAANHFVYMPDFTSGTDKIELKQSGGFANLALGALDEADFHKGDIGDLAGKHIAFDPTDGNLYYSANGTAGDAQMIGNVWYGSNVEYFDFTIVA